MPNEAQAQVEIIAKVAEAVKRFTKLADSVDRLTKELNELNTNKLNKQLGNSQAALKKTAAQATLSQKALSTLAVSFKGLLTTLVTSKLIQAFTNFARQIFELGKAAVSTKIKFDQIDLTLKAVTGSAAEADKLFNIIRSTAKNLGFDLAATAKEFSLLAAAAQDTALEGDRINDIFRSTTQVARVLGLSQKELSNIFKAFRDIISKNTVSMEELRRQLGNSLPRAMQFAAAALGTTQEEMVKMVESGTVLAEDLLPGMADQFDRFSASNIDEAMQTLAVVFGELRVVGQELLDTIGDGLEPGLRAVAEAAIEAGEAARPFAEDLSEIASNMTEIALSSPTLFKSTAQNIQIAAEAVADLTEEMKDNPIFNTENLKQVQTDNDAFFKAFKQNLIDLLGFNVQWREEYIENWEDIAEAAEKASERQTTAVVNAHKDITESLDIYKRTREKALQEQLDAAIAAIDAETEATEDAVDDRTDAMKRIDEFRKKIREANAKAREAALQREREEFEEHYQELIQQAEAAAGKSLDIVEETTEEISAELDERVDDLEESATKQEKIEEKLQLAIQKLSEATSEKKEKLIQKFLKDKKKKDADQYALEKKLQEDLAKLIEDFADKRERLFNQAADAYKVAQEKIRAEAEKTANKEIEQFEKRRKAAAKLAASLKSLLTGSSADEPSGGGGKAAASAARATTSAAADLRAELEALQRLPLITREQLARLHELEDRLREIAEEPQKVASSTEDMTDALAAFNDESLKFIQALVDSDEFTDRFKEANVGARQSIIELVREFERMAQGGRITEQDIQRLLVSLHELGVTTVDTSVDATNLSDSLRDVSSTLEELAANTDAAAEATASSASKLPEATLQWIELEDAAGNLVKELVQLTPTLDTVDEAIVENTITLDEAAEKGNLYGEAMDGAAEATDRVGAAANTIVNDLTGEVTVIGEVADAATEASPEIENLATATEQTAAEAGKAAQTVGDLATSLEGVVSALPEDLATRLADITSWLTLLNEPLSILATNLTTAQEPTRVIGESVGLIRDHISVLVESFPLFADGFLIFTEAVQNEIEAGNLAALSEIFVEMQVPVEKLGIGFEKFGVAIGTIATDGPQSVDVLIQMQEALLAITEPQVIEGIATLATELEDVVRAIIRGGEEVGRFREELESLGKSVLDLASTMTDFAEFLRGTFISALQDVVAELGLVQSALEASRDALVELNDELQRLQEEGVPAITAANTALDAMADKLRTAKEEARQLAAALAGISIGG